MASSHSAFARRIGSELENPLRSFSTSSDFTQTPQFEANLLSLAESHEKTREKSEKAKSKGKAKKQEDKVREENDARALWETESPLILERMQIIDESRMILLKDIFVKCMMMEVETSQQSMSESEGIMNSILSLTPAKEVAAFAAQQKDEPRPTGHERRRSIMQNNQTFTPTSSTTSSPATVRPAPVQTRSTISIPVEDAGSLRSEKRKSRFGTILRSSRDSMRPNLHIRGFSPGKKRKEAERERNERERAMSLTPVTSHTSQNGVTEPIPPARSSSIPNLEPQRSPIREELPTLRDDAVRGTEEAEQESILSSESNYAPQLRVEIMKEVIPEEAGEREAAVNTLQSTLRAQSTISRKNRGRREGRSSFVGNEANEFGLISPPIQEMAQVSITPTMPSVNPLTLSPIRYAESDVQSLSSVRTASRPGGITLHPDLEAPGFNISILESLSAILSDNKVQKVFITGEIALSSNGTRAGGITIGNPARLEQIVVNKALLNDSGKGRYALTMENLPPKGAIALKYKAALTDDPQSIVPLLIRAMWKIEQGSVSLMVGYQVNPAFPYMQTLSNVVISATLPPDARITGCQSKPQGQFSKERVQLLWNIPVVEGAEQIVIAKFAVDGQSKGLGMVEARWECKGITLSGIEVAGVGAKDPFADEEDIFFQANVRRNLISGKYYCQS